MLGFGHGVLCERGYRVSPRQAMVVTPQPNLQKLPVEGLLRALPDLEAGIHQFHLNSSVFYKPIEPFLDFV